MSTQSDNPPTHLNASDCDELRQLLPAYVIGATTPEEAEQVERLLPLCPELANDYKLYAALTEGLTARVDVVEPPTHLRQSFLDRVAAEERAKDIPQQKPPLTLTPIDSRSRVAWGAVAAVVVLLLAANAYSLLRVNAVEQELQSLEDEKRTVITLLNAERLQRISLQSTTNTETLARVFWNPETLNGTFYTDRFPTLDEAHTYQVWLIQGDEPISVGTFDVDDTGEGLLTFTPGADLQSFAAIAISVEPTGGSPAPTTDPMALGEIASS